MASIVIKKTISLEFLGEDYKDGYVTFRSIPISEAEKIMNESKNLTKDGKGSMDFILKVLKDNFLEGKFVDKGNSTDLTKEDLPDFDIESTLQFFKTLTGQGEDPKD